MVKELRILSRSPILSSCSQVGASRLLTKCAPAPRATTIGRTARAREELLLPGKSFLESCSIGVSVGIDYFRKLAEFQQWVRQSDESITSPAALDGALTRYFDQLFFQGYSAQYGEKVMASVMFAIPAVSKHGGATLVRARRALRGWLRVMPGKQRLPLPWPCLMAILGVLCSERKHWVAVALAVGYICYLRPGELDQLSHQQLVSPTELAGPRYQKWGLLLHPSSEDRVGKIGLQDEAVMIDRCEWLHLRLQHLARMKKLPGDRLCGPSRPARCKSSLRRASAGSTWALWEPPSTASATGERQTTWCVRDAVWPK